MNLSDEPVVFYGKNEQVVFILIISRAYLFSSLSIIESLHVFTLNYRVHQSQAFSYLIETDTSNDDCIKFIKLSK